MTTSKGLLDQIFRTAKRSPESIAIVESGAKQTSYRELIENSYTLAFDLLNCRENTARILLDIPKSATFIEAILGSWISGAAFIPLDSTWPTVRKLAIAEKVKPDVIISDDPMWQICECKDSILISPCELLRKAGCCDDNIISPKIVGFDADRTAYIIFTSGSSGEPKGVVVSHRGLESIIETQATTFGLRSTDKSLWILSPAFDASLSDIFTILLVGGELHIDLGVELRGKEGILKTIRERRISYIDIPPSLLHQIEPTEAPSLQIVVIGGEVCALETQQRWADNVSLFNVYGPTEATICTSIEKCSTGKTDQTIGWAVPGIRYHVLGTTGESAEEGELVIEGDAVGDGYWMDNELSAKKFSCRFGKRFYKTSDVVKRTVDGNFIFLGRKDRQLKIAGRLVEPLEIENAIGKIAGIAECGVCEKRAANSKKILAAYVVTKDGQNDEEIIRKLKAHLQQEFPYWMIPSLVEVVGSLPRTHTGKVNYLSLEKLPRVTPKFNESELQSTFFETKIIALWGSLLNARVTAADSFYSLGGDSITAVRVVVMAAEAGIPLSFGHLIGHLSIREIAQEIDRETLAAKSVGIHSSELRRDTYLPAEIRERILTRSVTPGYAASDGKIFITGATGYLGSAVLAELLKFDIEIVCLVRGEKDSEALQRVRDAVGIHTDPSLLPFENISVLLGDIEKKHFGLSVDRWNELSQTVGVVYHCAASVNLQSKYQDLFASNVQPVLEVLRFMIDGRAKKLHFASSLSVFAHTDRSDAEYFEDDRLLGDCFVRGGYAQSKWVSERMLWEAIETGLSGISIYRLGLLTGNSKTGKAKDDDFLHSFLLAVTEARTLPKEFLMTACDLSPIDIAVREMVGLAINSQNNGSKAFHIANDQSLTLEAISDFLIDHGFPIEIKNIGDWRHSFAEGIAGLSDLQQTRALAACGRIMSPCEVTESIHALDLFVSENKKWNRRNTSAQSDVSWPTQVEVLKVYLRDTLFTATNSAKEAVKVSTRRCQIGTYLTPADLYDTFLYKAHEVRRILSFHVRTAERFLLPRDLRLLDIGCGTGRMIQPFRAQGWNVTGFEPFECYYERAAEKYSQHVSIVRGGFGDIPNAPAYHLVTAINGPLYYLQTHDDRKSAVRNVFNTLLPGGIAVFDAANFLYLLKNYGDDFTTSETKPILDKSGKTRVITRSSTHDFNFHEARWLHRDRYTCEQNIFDGNTTFEDEHSFAMIPVPEILDLLEDTGFNLLETYSRWESVSPGLCDGSRVLVVAQKAG